jgi:hypothetical protein
MRLSAPWWSLLLFAPCSWLAYSTVAMAIQARIPGTHRVPDPTGASMGPIFYPRAAFVPNPNQDGYGAGILPHPWVTRRVPNLVHVKFISFCYINYDLCRWLNFTTRLSHLFVECQFWKCVYCVVLIKIVILICFYMWNGKPDTRLKPDRYECGYKYLPVGTGVEFYPQPLCYQASICSTRPEPNLLPSVTNWISRTLSSTTSSRKQSTTTNPLTRSQRHHSPPLKQSTTANDTTHSSWCVGSTSTTWSKHIRLGTPFRLLLSLHGLCGGLSTSPSAHSNRMSQSQIW